jgi:hypothetical protein
VSSSVCVSADPTVRDAASAPVGLAREAALLPWEPRPISSATSFGDIRIGSPIARARFLGSRGEPTWTRCGGDR